MAIKVEDRKREELVKFLDEKLFEPVLHASADDYKSEDLKKKLHEVQKHIEKEKHRFHDQARYPAVAEIKKDILLDLQSRTGRKLGHDLAELELPSFPKIKDGFLKLCDELKI